MRAGRRYRGAIADFRPPEFDPDYPFLVLGRGSLGGKGRGLAFMFRQLSQWLKDDGIQGVNTRLPRTLIIGADESDAFLRDNGMEVTSFGGSPMTPSCGALPAAGWAAGCASAWSTMLRG